MTTLMELVLQSTFAGQKCINRFNYEASGTPAAVSLSFALVSALGAIYDTVAVPPGYPSGTLLAAIAAASSAGVQFTNVVAKDVYSVTDFYDTTLVPNYNGAHSNTASSPTQAMGFISNRTRSDIKRGQKRFVGVPADEVNSGGHYASGLLTALALIATKMSTALTYDDEGNTLTFTPVVVGREKYVVPDSSPVRHAYRYYPTWAVQQEHLATSVIWTAYDTVRTQTSRQYGNGQ